jgi:FOG: TPR repeat
LNPALPAELDAIIPRALEKDRERRYQHAADIRSDLTRLKRETESASPAVLRIAPAPHKKVPIERWLLVLLAGAVGAIAIAAIAFFYPRRATLTEKDTIVLADFENKTGDQVFDEALKQALLVDLGQSPFLNILPDRKMAATLRMMGRSPDVPAMGEVARELCQRVGSKAMLAGSISNLGSEYVIGLNAINCSTGDTLVAEQARASGKGEVLKSLDNSASAMRAKLGESLVSVQKFGTPIEEATTSSLEALKAYSIGRRATYFKGDVAGIPYYQQALELDPNFALAYRALSVAYANLGQSTRAAENMKKAFELRERVSEHEKYSISGRYYSDVTGELDKANHVYELWSVTYPRDFLPPLNLGDDYMRLGEWENSLKATEASLRLEPNSGVTNSNMAAAQFALNHFEEAKTTIEQAIGHNMDYYDLRIDLYHSAFLRGDQELMQRQLSWGSGRTGEEHWLLSAQSDTEAYFGHFDTAREFTRRAVESAQRADAKETAALWLVNAAMREAEVGNFGFARQSALAALAIVEGRDIRDPAALALARAGDTSKARELADSLNRDFPQNTIVQGYWLPAIEAAIEIQQQNPGKAAQILQTATPYELAQSQPFRVGTLYPIYIRGQAFLSAHEGTQAAAEFQRIIDHRGIVLNFPLGALAHLQLGRAYVLSGETVKARAAYQDFLALWKNADHEIPILKQAKSEYAKLQ